MAFPPVATGDQETESWSATDDEAVGAPAVAGIVVAVIALDAEDAAEVPEAFVAVTVNV
jgi:hypothetical protein